jgi:tripartite-type tricarboxylate transporter receptor subunit TctC
MNSAGPATRESAERLPVSRRRIAVNFLSANAPFESVNALVDAAKTKQLTIASSGNGTVGQLVGETRKRAVAADMLHVPHKGAGWW